MRLIILFLLLLHELTSAHLVEAVHMEFEATEEAWVLGGVVDVSFMLPETRGVDSAEVIRRWDVMNENTPAEQEQMRVETEKTLRRCISFTFAGKPIDYRLRFVEFENEPLVLIEDPEDWAFFTVQLIVAPQSGPGDLVVHWQDETDASLIVSQMIEGKWTVWDVITGQTQTLLSKDASAPPSKVSVVGISLTVLAAICAFFFALRFKT